METEQITLLPTFARRWLISHHQLILALIVLGGVLASLGSLRGDTILHRQLESSPWTIAAHLYGGQGYTACSTDYFPLCHPGQQTAMREPVPVLMFAAVMPLLRSPASAVVLEILLYLGVIFLLYFSLAPRNPIFALTAAAFWAASVPVIEEIGDASGDLEGAFWAALGILLFLRARRLQRPLDWMLAGLVMGLAALSRSALLAGAVMLIAGIIFEGGSRLSARLRRAAWYALALCLVLAPWAVRNQLALGGPLAASSLTGYNLYRQNYYIGSPGFTPHYVGSKEAAQAVKTLIQAGHPAPTSNELQMDAFYGRAALRDIRAHPMRYAELSAFRFLSLWFNSTVKIAYGDRLDLLDMVMLVQQLFLLAAALVGTWMHRRTLWPVALILLTVCGAYLLVIGQVRYLVEVMPLIAILAASSFFPHLAHSRA